MSNAIFDLKTAEIGGGRFIFRAQAKKLIFDGYQKILKSQTKNNENDITILKEKEEVKLISANKEQHFTEPPGRFTEGSLVKELESKGIGRPSTYASIISTVQTRGYVLKKKRYLYPTELGKIVLQLLLNYFDNIFDYDFTKEMEEQLDEIENGKKDILPILKKFYSSLEKKLLKAGKEIAKAKKDIEEKTDIKCEICGRPMVIKWGKYGKFLACSGYPECKNTKPLEEEKVEGKCPKCGAPLVIKRGKFGRFVSCSNYPKCDYTSSIKTGVKCPVEGCDGDIVEKTTKKGKRFYGCSRYPKCKFALWDKPVNKPCPECGYPLLVEKYGRNGVYLKCPKCGAKFSQDDKK